MNPCPQMVIAGKAMSDMGLAVVLRVVIVGSACQTSYAWLKERIFFVNRKIFLVCLFKL